MVDSSKLPIVMRVITELTSTIDPTDVVEPSIDVLDTDTLIGHVDTRIIRLKGAIDRIIDFSLGRVERPLDQFFETHKLEWGEHDLSELRASIHTLWLARVIMETEVRIQCKWCGPISLNEEIQFRKGWIAVCCERLQKKKDT
jgi:hypothetical protein